MRRVGPASFRRLWPSLCCCLASFLYLGCPVRGNEKKADPAISFLEDRIKRDPDDFVAQNQLAARYLDLLRSTGDDQYRVKARHCAEASVAVGLPELNNAGIAALARVQQASHQFTAARETAQKLRTLSPGKSYSFGLLGDALLELGRYDEAVAAFWELARAEPNSLESETRLAALSIVKGQLDAAREHYNNALAAARDLNPPTPAVVAWCHVQLGQLYFDRGDWSNAEKNYEAALSALPDYWAAIDHLAELRGAQQKYPEAIALYQKVNSRVQRPELCQALGDLYLFMGKPAEAKPWHDKAAALYLSSTERGDSLYYHHLAGFYSDSVEQPADALKWALKDLENRQGIFAHDSMAWAFYRNGQFAEASAEMKKALATGAKNAHLFFHASMIATSTGDLVQGKEFLGRAAEINPRYNAFHVHR